MDDNHDAHGHQVQSAAFVSIYGGNLPAKFVNRNLKAQTMATPANSTVDPTATSIVFGPFRLSPMQRLLTEAGTPIHLGSRALDMLVALLERPGELVSKEELHYGVSCRTRRNGS
jgi:DNA-binding response OmpR family regulator